MASNFVEEFIVGLGFQFEGEDGERFKKQTQQISSAFMALSAAAAAATAALFAMTNQQAAVARNSDNTAKVMDTNAQSLGKWRYAAERAGVAGDEVVNTLQGLKTASQEAMRNGTGPFRAFQELGVDFKGIADGSVDVTDALDKIIETAQGMDRAMAQSGLRELGINPKLLDTPITKLRNYMEEFKKFGGVTDDLTKKSHDLDAAMGDAAMKFDGVENMLAVRLIPTYEKFFKVISEGLEWVQTKGFPILDETVEKLGGWDKVLGGLAIVAIPAVIASLGTLIKLLGAVTGGFGGAAAAAGLLARGGALAAVGVGGYVAGEQIREALPQDLVDEIDAFTLKSLAFLGVRSAKNQLAGQEGRQDEANQFIDMMDAQSKNPQPEDFKTAKPARSGRDLLMEAVIGRESGGKTGLTSSKGAMGLAQLMEPTARETAAELNIPFDKDKLLNDASYNRILGTAYMNKMLQKYGSEELAVAAYNAGPGSVDGWLKDNGDPRTGQISMQDWVKSIPFKETRDYTQNVMADRAGIVPPGLGVPGVGAAASQPSKVIHNEFHGLRQTEIEAIMRDAENEQQTLMSSEARDAIVR
jgi:soluble lytic murein transglycosylase-like protein